MALSAADAAAVCLPAGPPGGVTAGIDWSSTDHAVCVVDAGGAVKARFTVDHTAAGLAELIRRLHKAGAGEAAIERGDGPVVDALLAAGVTVVVITPGQLKNLRSRYGSADNKDDRFDGYVLADTLRTDRARLRPLQPDTPAGSRRPSACACTPGRSSERWPAAGSAHSKSRAPARPRDAEGE